MPTMALRVAESLLLVALAAMLTVAPLVDMLAAVTLVAMDTTAPRVTGALLRMALVAMLAMAPMVAMPVAVPLVAVLAMRRGSPRPLRGSRCSRGRRRSACWPS